MKKLLLVLLALPIQSIYSQVIYEKCAVENGICQFSGVQLVRYGALEKYVEKQLQGPVNCNNATFGDPIVGVVKNCEIRKQVVQQPSPTGSNPLLPQLGIYPITQGFPVYQGCSVPDTTYTRQVVLDGNLGQTLASHFGTKAVRPGDHIIVKGPQPAFKISQYSNAELVNTTKWIRIEGQGAVFPSMSIGGVGKILIHKVRVLSPTGLLFHLAAANNIVLADSEFYGALDSSAWEFYDWMNAPGAINSDNSNCVSVLRNKVKNARGGITISNRGTTVETASKKALVLNNDLRNISGDFMRPLGSDITMQYNILLDGYLSQAEGDGNHDDFIQGFALTGVPYTNVKILDNYIVNNTTPGRRFVSDYQGIAVFDGVYSNFVIARNIVIGGAYHGISMYGGQNGLIENNTVMSDYPAFGRSYWIGTFNKKGGEPSVNVTVRNNIANAVFGSPGATLTNNFNIKPVNAALEFLAFDVLKTKYDLRLKSTSLIYGKNAGAVK